MPGIMPIYTSFLSHPVMVMNLSAVLASAAPTIAPERSSQLTRQHFPNYKVIVLNDDFNTFEHVINCLVKYIPGMTPDQAGKLADQIHVEGQAIVWVGPLEQAEFYHMQLDMEGLTMAPLEAA